MYQSETGQLQCSKCPTIAGRMGVTAGPGARSAADCKGNIYLFKFNRRILNQNTPKNITS